MAKEKTVKVKMLTSVSGFPMPDYGLTREFSLNQGQEVELHSELAEKWAACGHCEIAKEAAK